MVIDYKVTSSKPKQFKSSRTVNTKPIFIMVATDSCNFHPLTMDRLTDLYRAPGCYICLSVMGKNPKDLISKLNTDEIFKIVEIPSPVFNYSYAINVAYRELIKDIPRIGRELMVLADSLSVFSIGKTEKLIRNTDPSKVFTILPILKNILVESPVNEQSERLLLSILAMVKKITEKKENPPHFIPYVSTTFDNFAMVGGLSEMIFTEVSRMQLVNQLRSYGKKEKVSEQAGLYISLDDMINEIQITNDLELIKYWEEVSKNYTMKNNPGIIFGDPERIKKIRTYNNKGYWVDEDPTVATIKSTEEKLVMPSYDNTDIVIKQPRSFFSPNRNRKEQIKKILIIMDNTCKNVVTTSALIKAAYNSGFKVDILTNRKYYDWVNYISGFMTDKIYDLHDLNQKIVNLEEYDHIVKSSGSTVPTTMISGEVLSPSSKANDFDSNMTLSENEFMTHKPITPYLNFRYNTPFKTPPGNIIVASSTTMSKFNSSPKEYWEAFSRITRYIADTGCETSLLNLQDEYNFITTVFNEKEKNIHRYTKERCEKALYLINNSSLVITSPHTDIFWMSLGLKKNTILFSNMETSACPNYPWIKEIRYSDDENGTEKTFNLCMETF